MSEPDLLAHGDDTRPPRRSGAAAGVAALALLALGLVAARSSPDGAPRARPAPSPSGSPVRAGWTAYGARPAPDPFEVYMSVRRPAGERPVALTIDRGVPVFLVVEGGAPRVYEATGGPEHARTLLGWCERHGTLQDPSGRWYYLHGEPSKGAAPMRTYPAREGVGTRGQVDIGLSARIRMPGGHVTVGPPCRADELVMPSLPGLARTTVVPRFATARMRGTYVLSREGASFCPEREGGTCVARPSPTLPATAGQASLRWEGEFLVRDAPGGHLTVVLTPSSRLVGPPQQ